MTKGVAIVLAAGAILLAACTGPSVKLPAPDANPADEENDVGLTAKTADALSASYGAPAFRHREPGSEIWRYDVGNCRIFFFLYQADGVLHVRRTETLPASSAADGVDRACIRALMQTAKQPS